MEKIKHLNNHCLNHLNLDSFETDVIDSLHSVMSGKN